MLTRTDCHDQPFFVLGTAKAGTTSLYEYMRQHSAVALTEPKETWYFCGPGYKKDEARDDFLRRFLPHRSGRPVYGEIATSYLYFPLAAERLARAFPEAKLIAILRDPIDRAFSDWWMMHSTGSEPLSFADAVDDNLRRLQRRTRTHANDDNTLWYSHLESLRRSNRLEMRTYVDYGYYDLQIPRYLRHYPQDRIQVLIFENVIKETDDLGGAVSRFLGLPSALISTNALKANPAFSSKSVRRALEIALRTGIHRLVPKQARRHAGAFLASLGNRPRLDEPTRKRLVEHYRDHVSALESILGISLSAWTDRWARVSPP